MSSVLKAEEKLCLPVYTAAALVTVFRAESRNIASSDGSDNVSLLCENMLILSINRMHRRARIPAFSTSSCVNNHRQRCALLNCVFVGLFPCPSPVL